jgi:voltage-gated potassium channel Kch
MSTLSSAPRAPWWSRSVRAPPGQGVTFVELFFDLVFVFAVTQVTRLLAHDLTWVGVARAALVFWLVWWAWTQFTWALNGADTTRTLVRVGTLAATGVAFLMAISVPNAFEAGQIIEQARAINPTLPIIARAHSDAEVDYLQKLGANVTIMGEREIADAMVEHALGTPPAPRTRIDGAQAPKPAATTAEADPEAVAGAVAAGDG